MFDGIPLENLSAKVLLGIAVLMILMGLLVPRRTYNDKVKESERWRLAFETSEKARAESDKQATELLEVAKTDHALIVAIFENSKNASSSGGKNVAS